jgi:hypothetical protein
MYLLYFALNVKVPKDPKTLKASNDPKNLRTLRGLRVLRVLKAPTHHIRIVLLSQADERR